MLSRSRHIVLASIVLASCCGFAGTLVSAQSSKDQKQIRDSLRTFAEVYSIVEQNYADLLDKQRADAAIYDGAIPEMLRTLDPHSNFFDPAAYAQMQENEQGKYYGVGMLISAQGDRVVVAVPYEGTPSFKAGIRPGDTIVAVDGKSTTNMSTREVSDLLKGDSGSHVHITLSRIGRPWNFTVDVVREEIKRPSVDLTEQIRPGIGYMRIVQFQATTGQEFDDALNRFGPHLRGLLIDMRDNPGGYVSAAVAVCDRLLARRQVIVIQRGRAFPERIFYATHGNSDQTYPVIVLVNRGTASAAEIVTGALQDHDRALIVGETTFGKGLVQSIYSLSDKTGLTLTTYHYYTPSGRLIQRNYKGVSLYDYYYNHSDAENTAHREVTYTDSGRKVYGGGGITPDIHISPPKLAREQEILLAHNAFVNFAAYYLANRSVTRNFRTDATVLQAFQEYVRGYDIRPMETERNGMADWLKSHITAAILSSQFGQTAGDKILLASDPMIDKALTFFPQANTLEQTALKIQAKQASSAG